MREPERPIDPPEGAIDLHDLEVSAFAQLEAEGGVDVGDLHDPVHSQYLINKLVGSLFYLHRTGNLPIAERMTAKALEEIADSEREAIAEELRAQLEYDDSEY